MDNSKTRAIATIIFRMRFFSPYFSTIVNHWDCRFLQVAAHHELADAQTPAAALPGKGEAVSSSSCLAKQGQGFSLARKGGRAACATNLHCSAAEGWSSTCATRSDRGPAARGCNFQCAADLTGACFQFSRIGPHPSDEGSLQAIFSSSAPAPGHSADIGIYRRRPGRPGIQSDSERWQSADSDAGVAGGQRTWKICFSPCMFLLPGFSFLMAWSARHVTMSPLPSHKYQFCTVKIQCSQI